MKLLLIDDDVDILTVNKKFFEKKSYDVLTADNAEDAVRLFHENRIDCIILDIRMDTKNGYELCSYFKKFSDAPVIFLTNLSQEEALLKGFSCGGDDYMAKPYRLRELEARILARVRDRKPDSHLAMDFPGLCLDYSKKQAFAENRPVGLTQGEFEILWFLASNKGIPYSQEEIYQALWGADDFYNSHSIQILIMRIRKKLEAACPEACYIKTRWGKGYLFTASS